MWWNPIRYRGVRNNNLNVLLFLCGCGAVGACLTGLLLLNLPAAVGWERACAACLVAYLPTYLGSYS